MSKKSNIQQEVETEATPTAQPLLLTNYVGPDYGSGILLRGVLLQPRTWSQDQINQFLLDNPDRESWFSTKI